MSNPIGDAIALLQKQRNAIDKALAVLTSIDGSPSAAPAPTASAPKARKKMSAARRKALSNAMKKRWAAKRKG